MPDPLCLDGFPLLGPVKGFDPHCLFPPDVIDPEAHGRRDKFTSPQALKPLRLAVTERGCIVPTNHKPHVYGYTIVRQARFNGKSGLEALHRLAYCAAHGLETVPEGWEVDHRCPDTLCINPRHLWIIPRREHRFLTGKLRFAEQKIMVERLWRSSGCTLDPDELAPSTSVTAGKVSEWLNAMLAEERQDRIRWGLEPA